MTQSVTIGAKETKDITFTFKAGGRDRHELATRQECRQVGQGGAGGPGRSPPGFTTSPALPPSRDLT